MIFNLPVITSFLLLALPLATAQDPVGVAAAIPTYNLKTTFGAKGGDVVADTAAFQAASKKINEVKAAVLTIPKATYIVSGQRKRLASESPATVPYWVYDGVFNVNGLTKLVIVGNGATVKLADNLKYGSFDERTGAPFGSQTTARNRSAAVGPIIQVWNSGGIEISNLNIDGNNQNLDLGGGWGDTGRQNGGHGFVLDNCPGAKISSCTARRCALDGFGVRDSKKKEPTYNPVRLTSVIAEYNGRQGLSWIGGNGLIVTNSEFSRTGRNPHKAGGVFFSSPGAGLDIEPNGGPNVPQWTRGGQFSGCTFADNRGPGVVAPFNPLDPSHSPDGGYTRFDKCTLQAPASPAFAAILRQPGLSFYDTTFIGRVHSVSDGTTSSGTRDPKLATTFTRCTFKDSKRSKVDPLVTAAAAGATWTDCTFTSLLGRSLAVSLTAAYANPKKHSFINCRFTHGPESTNNNTNVATITGADFSNGCVFTETPELTASTLRFRLYLANVNFGDSKIIDSTGKPSKRIWR